jgi:hypothetical protein
MALRGLCATELFASGLVLCPVICGMVLFHKRGLRANREPFKTLGANEVSCRGAS